MDKLINSNGIPKTIVVGAKGYIGSHFLAYYRKIHPGVIGTHYLPFNKLKRLDLACPEKYFSGLEIHSDYSYALIAGGVWSPQKCEKNPLETYQINVNGVFSLCTFFLERNITPIFISSGYVFNGKKGDYLENDPTSPINEYGIQKCALENRLQSEFGGRCLIVRVGKVYGLQLGDQTLLYEIASSLFSGKKVLAAEDQIFSPISIDDVIRGISVLQMLNCRGIYHLGGPQGIARYDLAISIAKALGADLNLIEKVSLDQIPSNFRRAKKTHLISEKFYLETGFQITPIQENILRFVQLF